MVNSKSHEKQRIASLQIKTAFSGNEEIYLYEEHQHGVLEYRDLRFHDEEHAQKKLIDLKPDTFAKLKSKMDFNTPQALEPHCMGLDGVTYDLTIYKSEQEQKYSWWVVAPKGWESIVDAVNALLYTAGLNNRVEVNL